MRTWLRSNWAAGARGKRQVALAGLLAAVPLAGGVMAVGLMAVVAVRLFTPLAIPGWTSTVAGLLLVLLLQTLSFASAFAFLVLHARSQPAFIPLRDYQFFVDRCTTLVARASAPLASPGP